VGDGEGDGEGEGDGDGEGDGEGEGTGVVWYRMITWVLLLGTIKFVMLSFRIGSRAGIW